MTDIIIIAEVDGVIALAQIRADLIWIPMNMGATVETNALPHRIRRIEIDTGTGRFCQEVP